MTTRTIENSYKISWRIHHQKHAIHEWMISFFFCFSIHQFNSWLTLILSSLFIYRCYKNCCCQFDSFFLLLLSGMKNKILISIELFFIFTHSIILCWMLVLFWFNSKSWNYNKFLFIYFSFYFLTNMKWKKNYRIFSWTRFSMYFFFTILLLLLLKLSWESFFSLSLSLIFLNCFQWMTLSLIWMTFICSFSFFFVLVVVAVVSVPIGTSFFFFLPCYSNTSSQYGSFIHVFLVYSMILLKLHTDDLTRL